MRKAIIINILALFLIGSVFSQSRILKGQILDENLQPIPFASIKTAINGINSTADKLGNFEIEIIDGEKEVQTYYIGQISEKVNILNKCYINIIVLRSYMIEFETIQEEAKFYQKLRKKTERKYRKAVKSGLLKKEENCK